MIRAVHISRFRGIRECVADGFGRVNLIIGRNDCGKTAFMEALQLVDDGEEAARRLLLVQRNRLRRVVKTHDFERFWRPIFFDLDARAGLSIWIVREDGSRQTLEVRQGEVREEIITDRNDSRSMRDRGNLDDEAQDLVKPPAWALELRIAGHDQPEIIQRVVATSAQLALPPHSGKERSAWITSSMGLGDADIKSVSALKQRGQDSVLLEILREVDPRVSGIELLAPGGEVAELFVRLDSGTPMLPIALMGDGFQRCLEIGAAAAAHEWPALFIDEVENGMHHLVLEPLWRWIAAIARRRGLQVFATTHSEECIHAACRAFQGIDDDGLRVIRLDRVEGGTRATFYDRALVEAAERTGIEIRG